MINRFFELTRYSCDDILQATRRIYHCCFHRRLYFSAIFGSPLVFSIDVNQVLIDVVQRSVSEIDQKTMCTTARVVKVRVEDEAEHG